MLRDYLINVFSLMDMIPHAIIIIIIMNIFYFITHIRKILFFAQVLSWVF